MANVLLINLAIIKFYDKSEIMKETYNPPLGLLYMASTLTNSGHTVKIIDYINVKYSKMEILKEIEAFNPIILGISVYTENIEEAFKLSRSIKRKLPYIKIVLGGPQASLEPQYCINNKNIDYVLKHEGESSMLELVEALESKETMISLKDITGIVYYDESGTLIENKKRKDINDLDLLPFPLRRSDEITQYGNIVNLITSRGCPGKCVYCAATALSGAKYRVRSVENTLLEIMYIKAIFKEHLKVIYILDDTFTGIPERVFEFLKLKKKLKADFLWRCESRVDVVTEEMVDKLAESQCIGIAFGVESGSQDVLNQIHKNIDLNTVVNVVDILYKHKIYVSLNFMLGHFCDTVETMNSTYDFIKKMYDAYRVGIFVTYNTPFPGTWQATHMEKIGLKLQLTNYSEYSAHSPSVSGRNFTISDQVKVYQKILPIIMNNDFGIR